MKRRSFLAGLLGSTFIAPAAIAARPPEPIALRPGEKIIVTTPTSEANWVEDAIAALDAAEVPTASRFVFDGKNWVSINARKAR